MCDTIMGDFPCDKIGPNIGMFTYHHGVFLSGMEQIYHLTGERKYFDYIKGWMDSVVDENGEIRPVDNVWCSLATLDYRQAGILLFELYRETQDERYHKVLVYLTESLKSYPVNSYGVFWHFAHTPNEVWLDGLYMASPLMSKYGAVFHKPEFIDMAVKQAQGMYCHMRGESGLLRHGWDETKQAVWADKRTGLSANVWGRAMGWYLLGLVNILDDLPAEHQERSSMVNILTTLLKEVCKYQGADGRWYQVLDKVTEAGNWPENSCSCIFVGVLAKSIRLGYLGMEYYASVKSGFEGVLHSLREEKGRLILTDVCTGTCIEDGSYQHYIHRERIENDLHGGVFLMMCAEVERLEKMREERKA